MARKFIISLLVIFFIITFSNSLPLKENSISKVEVDKLDKRQATPPYYVMYAEFDPTFDIFNDAEQYVTGTVTFTRLNNGDIRVYGQCNTGFTDPDTTLYTIIIVPRPLCPLYIKRLDLTNYLEYTINPPGTSAFQNDFNTFTLEEIHDYFVVVKMGGTPIGAAQIKAVGEK